MISIDTLRRLFSEKPDKSPITFKGKCCDCGCDVTVNIAVTSGGFGLLGGFLFEPAPDGYCSKCPDCYKKNPAPSARYKYKCTIVK